MTDSVFGSTSSPVLGRRTRQTWVLVDSMTPREADSHISSLSNISVEGYKSGKLYYRCSFYKKFKCKWKLRTSRDLESGLILVEENGNPHHHPPNADGSLRGLSQFAKEKLFVMVKYNRNIKPAQARTLLLNNHPELDSERTSLRRVQRFIETVRKDALRSWYEETIGGLATFINSNLFDHSATAHNLFFLKGAEDSIIDTDDEDYDLTLFFSTKSLLSSVRLLKQTCIDLQVCCDTTFRITLNGCPITIFGISDAAHQFVPVSFALRYHEDIDTYVDFMLKTKNIAQLKCNTTISPKYTMSDNCDALFAAFREVFPGAKRLSCFAHVVRKLRGNCRSRINTDLENTEGMTRNQVKEAQKSKKTAVARDFQKDIEEIH